MKQGWTLTTLGEICLFDKVQGIWADLPYVGLEDIEPNTGKFIGTTEPQEVKSTTFRFTKEHVLYGRLRPYLNKALAPNFEGHCSTEIFPIKPSADVLRAFLLYWLLSNETCQRVNDTCTGARMPRAQMNIVLGFDFLLPPLPEQHRIVAILDAAFAAIATARAHTEQNLRNARELFESQLAAVFSQRGAGWEIKQFDDVLEIRNGKNQTSVESSDGQYPIFGSAGKVMGYATDFLCEAGTTIIGRKGTINSPIFSDTKFWNVDTAFGLSPKPRLDAKFLYYFCLSYDFNLHNRGTTIPSLVKTDLLQISIPVPPLPEQRHIVEKLDAAKAQSQTLQSLAQRKLAALDELKQSLLQRAFGGQL